MKRLWLVVCVAAVLSIGLAACGGSSGGGGGNNNTTVPLTPGTAAKGTITTGGTNTLNVNFPANAVSTATTATITEVTESSVPSIKSIPIQLCAGNTYVMAFSIALSAGVTAFNVPIPIDGIVPAAQVNDTYTLAMLNAAGTEWELDGTVTVAAGGVFTQNGVSVQLPGILGPGTYLIYKPDPACNIAVSNLGIALVADDGSNLQVIQVEDKSGNALATPTMTVLNYSGATDLDGQALTPDGSQGVLMDGGDLVYFFSNVQTGVPIARLGPDGVTPLSVDVSSYGGDGDSIAIMPNGDEAVASADLSSELVLISGIVSGTPVVAETITVPHDRDGVLISNDGKVLLARGSNEGDPVGLTVFAIAAITPTAGSIGGTVSHSFTQIVDIPTLGTNSSEDGRDGMAISPTDSSRAVIIGSSTANDTVTLVTGLPGTVATPPTAGTPITLTGITQAYSVSITPDGKTAIVGTDAGIVVVSGVDTGTLAQVGAPFAPSYTGTGGSSLTLGTVTTLGITLDAKYVVVCDSSNSSLLVIPISGTTLSAPVGVLNGVTAPSNDQMVLH